MNQPRKHNPEVFNFFDAPSHSEHCFLTQYDFDSLNEESIRTHVYRLQRVHESVHESLPEMNNDLPSRLVVASTPHSVLGGEDRSNRPHSVIGSEDRSSRPHSVTRRKNTKSTTHSYRKHGPPRKCFDANTKSTNISNATTYHF